MIRHVFHVNPYQLSIDEWSRMLQQAMWIKRLDLKNLAELLSSLFKSDTENNQE